MKNGKTLPAEHERACARVAAQFRELWLRIYVGRKLRSDPVYPGGLGIVRRLRTKPSSTSVAVSACSDSICASAIFQAPIVGLDRDRPQNLAGSGSR